VFSLTYIDATGAPARVPLHDGITLIGRGAASTLVINVASVSRHHARVRVEGGRCLLSDAGSTYGRYDDVPPGLLLS